MMSLTNTIILHAPMNGAAGDRADRERARLSFLSRYQAAIANRKARGDKVHYQPGPDANDSALGVLMRHNERVTE